MNNPINTIANEFNGNIDNSNIKSAAAIAGSKISIASMINPYKFSVYRSAAATNSNTNTKVSHDTKLFDTGSNVDVVTNKGRFTAPIAGFYYFNASSGDQTASATPYNSFLYKNGSEVKRGGGNNATTAGGYASVSGLLQLAANDYVEHYFVAGNGTLTIVGVAATYFEGFFVSA